MHDDFTQKLFEIAQDSPDLQQALLNKLSTKSAGYSIPTGNIALSVFEGEDSPRKEQLIKAIKKAGELRVKDLARILGELRTYLTLEEVQGKKLDNPAKTLRDIDIMALATWALLEWGSFVLQAKIDNMERG